MSWPTVRLESLQSDEPRAITDGPFGSHLARRHYTDSGARVVRLQNIGDGVYLDNPAYISKEHFETLKTHSVLPGDLLIASLGEVLPRACLAPVHLGPAIVKADCIRVRLSHHVDPKWVMYSMQRPEVRAWADEQRHGVGRPRLGLGGIRRIPVPLAPLREQRRIVDILEEHLSKLDAADYYLQDALRLSTALVSKQLSATRLGELVPLAEIAEIQGGIQKQQKRAPRDHAYPFLRVANVTASGLDLADVHRVELFGNELDRLRLRKGDLLVVEGNGSPAQIGRAALWDGSIEDCVHQNHLIRVRANEAIILPGYLEAVWNSPENRANLTEVSSSSSGLHTLSVSKLGRILIPLPDLSNQIDALRELDTIRLAQRRLVHALASASTRGSALRRAVLAAAFSGRLTGHASEIGVIEGLNEEESA